MSACFFQIAYEIENTMKMEQEQKLIVMDGKFFLTFSGPHSLYYSSWLVT